MDELKTLKDIDLQDLENVPYILKQEAIKWIKELERVNEIHTLEHSEFTSHGVDSSSNSNVVRWIKHYHNITERDLK